jgi:hypothetical protein
MSNDPNGFRAYEAAIIGGMLASGKHTLASVQERFTDIRKTARKFSGAVSDVYYPTGTCSVMVDTARQALYNYLDTPKPLGKAIGYLESQGFDERVIHYTISVNTGVYAGGFKLNVVGGEVVDTVTLSRGWQ